MLDKKNIDNKKYLTLSVYEQKFFNEFLNMPNRGDHNIVAAYQLHGKIDLKKLAFALNDVVTQYQLLNSYVKLYDSIPYWEVNTSRNDLIIENSLTEQEIIHLVSQPFDLCEGPLYRFIYSHEGINQGKLIIVLHHILVKDDTMHLFNQILSQYYNDDKHKVNCVEPYSIQANKHLKMVEAINSHLKYYKQEMVSFWKQALEKVEIVDLSFLAPNKKIPDYKKTTSIYPVKKLTFKLDYTTTQQLYKIKEYYKISPFFLTQIIYAYILSRHSITKRFAISYPISIKHAQNVDFGGNININLMPFDFTNNRSIVDCIQSLKKITKGLAGNVQKNSLLPIIDLLANQASAIANIAFAQSNMHPLILNLHNIKVYSIDCYRVDLSSPFIIEQGAVGGELLFCARYSPQQVDVKLLEAFIGRYSRLCNKIINDLTKNIVQKTHLNTLLEETFLSKSEYINLIYKWNNSANVIKHSQSSIINLFEQQVAQTPNNIAIIAPNQNITYLTLNNSCNQLVHFLKPHDVVGQPIILFFYRNSTMITAILSVLKMGGIYVPIDPTYPIERIRYILEDTQSQIILTDSKGYKLLESLSYHSEFQGNIYQIDEKRFIKNLNSYPIANLNKHIAPDQLAYIIYTSGSTGRPKGVKVRHNGVINFIRDLTIKYNLKYSYENHEVIALLSNYVFDASVEQIFLPLLNGHSLLIVPRLIWDNDSDFIEYLREKGATHLHHTPSYLKQFNFSVLPKLKRLIFGGEELTESTYNQMRYPQGCKIITEYGLAETSVTSSVCFMNSKNDLGIIGEAVSNTRLYVLDTNNLSPTPVNVIGEIYIGGIGVAAGYLNLPKLTQKRFIDSPFHKGEMLYKTGDIGRNLGKGCIEYIGRNDFQIKISGYRIELAEIEYVLAQYPEVNSVVVLAKELQQNPDIKYLVGYYVSKTELNHHSILEYLFDKLPNYMVPKTLIHLPELPLTINGKLDRAKLLALQSRREFLAPNTNLAITMATIWEKILRIKNVGLFDNFFLLGGNSLAATRAVAMAQQENIALEFHELYHSKNLQELTNILIAKTYKIRKQVPTKQLNNYDKNVVPLSLFQQENIKQYSINPTSFNTLVVCELKGHLNRNALEHAYNQCLKLHEVFRVSLQYNNKEWQQHITPFAAKKLDIKRLNDLSEFTIQQELDLFANQQYNASNNPPMRFLLLSKDSTYNILVLSLNHFFFDSLSFDLLLNDICDGYNNFPAEMQSKAKRSYTEFSLNHLSLLAEHIAILQNTPHIEQLFKCHTQYKALNNLKNQQFTDKAEHLIEYIFNLDDKKILSRHIDYTLTPYCLAVYGCFLLNALNVQKISIPYLMTLRPHYLDMMTIGNYSNIYPINIDTTISKYRFDKIMMQVRSQLELVRKAQNIPFHHLARCMKYQVPDVLDNILYVSQNMSDANCTMQDLSVRQILYSNQNMREAISFELLENPPQSQIRMRIKAGYFTKKIKALCDTMQEFINCTQLSSQVDIKKTL